MRQSASAALGIVATAAQQLGGLRQSATAAVVTGPPIVNADGATSALPYPQALTSSLSFPAGDTQAVATIAGETTALSTPAGATSALPYPRGTTTWPI